ncbi:MAG: phosphotransferase family protein [Promethearchaeota archaeon]
MVQSKLLAYLQRRFPEHQMVAIRDFRSVGEGWETRIHGFTWDYTSHDEAVSQKIIIRMFPGCLGTRRASHEFQVIRTLYELGYPVPKVHLVETKADPVGMPFILMDLIEGSTMDQLFRSGSPDQHSELISLFGDLFLRLHRLAWQPFNFDEMEIDATDPFLYIRHTLSEIEDRINNYNLEVLRPIHTWLQKRSTQASCEQLSITHGDFHPNNILIDKAGAPYVIDWTAAHIADAREDLAWSLLLARTFRGPELREQILQAYETQLGHQVQELEYFEVIAIFRRLSDFLIVVDSDSVSTGLRSDIVTIMGQHKRHYLNVCAVLQERTNITLPTVEKIINGLSDKPAE